MILAAFEENIGRKLKAGTAVRKDSGEIMVACSKVVAARRLMDC